LALSRGKYNESYQYFSTAMKNDADNFTVNISFFLSNIIFGFYINKTSISGGKVTKNPKKI